MPQRNWLELTLTKDAGKELRWINMDLILQVKPVTDWEPGRDGSMTKTLLRSSGGETYFVAEELTRIAAEDGDMIWQVKGAIPAPKPVRLTEMAPNDRRRKRPEEQSA